MKGLSMRVPTILSLAFSILATASPFAAYAQNDDTERARVKVSDLDLSSRAGMNELDRRIRGAAKLVCGEPVLGTVFKSQQCINEAVASVSATRARLIASAGTPGTANRDAQAQSQPDAHWEHGSR
jgi:UrcA family protein